MTEQTTKPESVKMDPIILGIGGGKGGVGKSMVSANLAVQYAQAGLKVILLDLDFGAANLHTIFGLRQPEKTLGDYFTSARSQLEDYLIHTEVDNLLFAPGSGFVPELANLKHLQKTKLINHIKALDAHIVLLDLGAGSSINVVDFFSMTNAGIVVTTPEPTAIVNAYEFLKNVMYRIFFRMFRNHEQIVSILKISTAPNNPLNISTIADLIDAIAKENPWIAESAKEVCKDLDFHVLFNQARKAGDAQLVAKLQDISKKHLCLDLNYAGLIFHNEEVSASVFKMRPISLESPSSITAQTLKRAAMQILNQVVRKMGAEEKPNEEQGIERQGEKRELFEAQLTRVISQAHQDFEKTILAVHKTESYRLKFHAMEGDKVHFDLTDNE